MKRPPFERSQRYIGFDILFLFIHKAAVTKLLFSGLLISLVLLVDQYLLIRITRYLGTYVSLAAHACTGLIAVLFIRNSIFIRIYTLCFETQPTHSPEKLIAKIAIFMFAAFLLIIPGLLTDMCGILLLIPPFKHIASYLFLRSHATEIEKTKEHLHLIIASEHSQKS